jgi:hypothetical protein
MFGQVVSLLNSLFWGAVVIFCITAAWNLRNPVTGFHRHPTPLQSSACHPMTKNRAVEILPENTYYLDNL